jgi:putative protease
VAIVVSIYRQALNHIRDGTWSPNEQDLFDLAMAFNRGFTPGFLLGETVQRVMGRERPDNRGVFLGHVAAFDPGTGTALVQMERPLTLRNGDGLVIAAPGDGSRETGVLLTCSPQDERGTIRIPVREKVSPGDEVFLTKSAALGQRAERILQGDSPGGTQTIPVDIGFTIGTDGVPVLEGTAATAKGLQVSRRIPGTIPFVPAKTRPLTKKQVRAQLAKMSGTLFHARSIDVDCTENWFAPVSSLNLLRRELLAALGEAMAGAWHPPPEEIQYARERLKEFLLRGTLDRHGSIQSPDTDRPVPGISVYASSPDAVKGAVSAGADRIYFEPQVRSASCPPGGRAQNRWYGEFARHIFEQLSEAAEICRNTPGVLVWKLPRITRDALLVHTAGIIPHLCEIGIRACMVEGTGAADALHTRAPALVLYGGAGLNVFNHLTAQFLAPQFSRLTLSPELSGAGLGRLIRHVEGSRRSGIEVIVQGNLEAVIAEDRLLATLISEDDGGRGGLSGRFYGLRDGTGRIFPVFQDSECRTRILNAVELCLIDHTPGLIASGTGSMAIDARGRTGAYAEEMVRIYRQAAALPSMNEAVRHVHLADLRERARAISRGGITAGHYRRGVHEDETG